MQIVTLQRFKQINRKQKLAGASLATRKQMIAPAEQTEARNLRFTISTASVDRERDVINVNGWDLTNFVRNPVTLWAHDYSLLPIGRAVNVGIDGNALKAEVQFVPADTPVVGQFAEAVYQLCVQRFIGATSVGFRPTKWDFTNDKARGADDWFPGIDFEEQELVELSVVTVPANPEALMEEPAIQAPALPGEVAALEAARRKQDQEQARARRVRVLQLAQVTLSMSLAQIR